jgi:hypothetical protein
VFTYDVDTQTIQLKPDLYSAFAKCPLISRFMANLIRNGQLPLETFLIIQCLPTPRHRPYLPSPLASTQGLQTFAHHLVMYNSDIPFEVYLRSSLPSLPFLFSIRHYKVYSLLQFRISIFTLTATNGIVSGLYPFL